MDARVGVEGPGKGGGMRSPARNHPGGGGLGRGWSEGSGGYPPEIVRRKGQFDISSLQMEVNSVGEATGRFRTKRGGEILKPIGDWPENWLDDIHEFYGHGVEDTPEGREGEIIQKGELDSLYVQDGIEGAVDDVSGATLGPDMGRAGREVEMGFFKSMGVYGRLPGSEQRESGSKIIGTKWIDVNKGDFDKPKSCSRLVET